MNYRPKWGFVGNDRFLYRVNDGSKYSRIVAVKIKVKKTFKKVTSSP